MLTPYSISPQHISLAPGQLLTNGEVVVIIDDDPAIRAPLAQYLEENNLAVVEGGSAADLHACLANRKVAMVLLDIGLPDSSGAELIPELQSRYPDLAIVMLTGVADLHVAMDCIRKGADDYLAKPAKFSEILFVVRKNLEKRRLIFENRKYQEELEQAHFRIQLMHQLSLKMNTVYLSTVELDKLLLAILVGITANEGLRFNRAFLALFDDAGKYLEGRLAIGTTCRETAARVWQEMQQKDLKFLDIVHNLSTSCAFEDQDVNVIIRQMRIPVSDNSNILIRSALERRSIRIDAGNGGRPILHDRHALQTNHPSYPNAFDRRNPILETSPLLPRPDQLIDLLKEENFIVVPLFSPGRSFGVIIADNFVTRSPILDSHLNALELFASQASLAIEHSHLYIDMQKKLRELEELYQELAKNKDQLVQAERYSALGQMSAQMVHNIRNPVTAIGGVARLLNRRTLDDSLRKYSEVIIKESERLEKTLADLRDFVEDTTSMKEAALFSDITRKTLLLLQRDMEAQHITIAVEAPADEPRLLLDRRRIRQMLLQLFRNAMDAMPDGGKLSISISREDDQLVALIRDTGTGIQDNFLGKVSETFFTTKTYGTGMGLTLVERIIKAHNGTFSLHNTSPGAEVVIRLPCT
ncbi:MAG: response regulator [Thermodesulfobacteriota bacterium]